MKFEAQILLQEEEQLIKKYFSRQSVNVKSTYLDNIAYLVNKFEKRHQMQGISHFSLLSSLNMNKSTNKKGIRNWSQKSS